MKTKRRVMIAIVVLAMFLIAGQVLAFSYNYNINPLSYAVTPNEPKTGNCNWGLVTANSVSPSTDLIRVKMEDFNNNQIGPPQDIGQGGTHLFPDSGSCGVGQLRHFAFNNNYFYNVAISGSWFPG